MTERISSDDYRRKRKRSKFGAVKTWQDGLCFDSRAELERWNLLLSRNAMGVIRNLRRQVTFEFFAGFVKMSSWRVDFTYEEKSPRICPHCNEGMLIWRPIAEDYTGAMTAQKQRHMRNFEEQYGAVWELRITGVDDLKR